MSDGKCKCRCKKKCTFNCCRFPETTVTQFLYISFIHACHDKSKGDYGLVSVIITNSSGRGSCACQTMKTENCHSFLLCKQLPQSPQGFPCPTDKKSYLGVVYQLKQGWRPPWLACCMRFFFSSLKYCIYFTKVHHSPWMGPICDTGTIMKVMVKEKQ